MLRSVLVPLDGSAFGEQALPLARSIARRSGARLELAHVSPPLGDGFPELAPAVAAELEREEHEEAARYLDAVVRRTAESVAASGGRVAVEGVLLEGRVADALCERVARAGIDLVVLTTHGRGPLSAYWLGSVASDLISRLEAPALLVRPREPAPAAEPEPTLRRILIALDGSELAEQILDPALALGRTMDAEYRLLRVVPPVLIGGQDGGAGRSGRGAAVCDLLAIEAKSYLERVGKRLDEQVLPPETRVIIGWPPASAILEDAAAHGADVIALATHGRGGLVKLLLGSVADKVVRGAQVPVLVRRPRK